MLNRAGFTLMRMVVRNNILIAKSLNSSASLRGINSKEVYNFQIPSSSVYLPVLESSVSPKLITTPPCNVELPIRNKILDFIDCPNLIFPHANDKFDPTPLTEINEPQDSNKIEKRAARLIVIRRKKMKKHKLKKLRKKMKYVWAKVRQRRELRKEKAFQATLLAQISEAEKFDASEYVREKLKKVNLIISSKSVDNVDNPNTSKTKY